MKDKTHTRAIDKHVGNRLRVARHIKQMSQEALGEMVGLTFQQIQKYEKGANRISASKLHQFSQILGVGPGYFFEGAPEEAFSDAFACTPNPDEETDERTLLAVFRKLPPNLKKTVLDLTRNLRGSSV